MDWIVLPFHELLTSVDSARNRLAGLDSARNRLAGLDSARNRLAGLDSARNRLAGLPKPHRCIGAFFPQRFGTRFRRKKKNRGLRKG